jgi:hypothetical protein
MTIVCSARIDRPTAAWVALGLSCALLLGCGADSADADPAADARDAVVGKRMAALIALGVHGMFTDDPVALQPVLAARN